MGALLERLNLFNIPNHSRNPGSKWTDDNLDKRLADTEKIVPDKDIAFFASRRLTNVMKPSPT